MLKRIYTYCLLVCLVAMVSCHRHYQYPAALQDADSLCNAYPDSAVALLRSITSDMNKEQEYVQMRYKLLTIKANDKAYINHTSDSLILSLVDYYEHGGDKDYLGEAYYYAGSTYRDLGDAPRALEYYQKALDAMPGNENLKVKSKVYAQMGSLFHHQNLYREALKQFMTSLECDKMLHDTASMVHNLLDMGFMYRGLDKPDSTLFLLDHALRLAKTINNAKMINMASTQLSSLYIRLGDYEKAKMLIEPYLKEVNRINLSSVYSITANIYFHKAQYDSAAFYYKQLLANGTIYARCTANERLAYIALHEWHDAEQTLTYSEQYALLQDSINSITATESTSQMNALYNYNLREKENSRLQIKQKNYQLYFTTGIIIFLLMAVGISLHVLRNKHKRQLLQSELQKEMAKNYYFEEYIAQREAVIEQMEREADTMGSENHELKAEIARQRQLLDDYTLSAKQTQDLALLIPGDIKTSPVYTMIHIHIRDCRSLKDNEIALIIDMMIIYYPVFMKRLMLLSRLSLQEQLICILTKLNISNKDIALLTAKSESTISSTRIRIYGKVMNTKGTTKDFNSLINSL